MNSKTLSTLLLIAGVALLVLGYFEPQIRAGLVIVVADDTSPVWLVNPDGSLAVYPKDGDVYGTPLTQIQASALDPESGVKLIEGYIDGIACVPPMTWSRVFHYGFQFTSILATPIASGSHLITFVATNNVGLKTTYSGSFSFSTVIEGTWYVNEIKITSSTQTVYSPSLTLNFSFSRTAGTVVACTVTEGSTLLLTLSSTDSSTWRGSYTFTGGAHSLTLTASDGTTSIIMAMVSVDFGGLALNFTTEQLAMFAVGACCLAGGGYLRLPKKK